MFLGSFVCAIVLWTFQGCACDKPAAVHCVIKWTSAVFCTRKWPSSLGHRDLSWHGRIDLKLCFWRRDSGFECSHERQLGLCNKPMKSPCEVSRMWTRRREVRTLEGPWPPPVSMTSHQQRWHGGVPWRFPQGPPPPNKKAKVKNNGVSGPGPQIPTHWWICWPGKSTKQKRWALPSTKDWLIVVLASVLTEGMKETKLEDLIKAADRPGNCDKSGGPSRKLWHLWQHR